MKKNLAITCHTAIILITFGLAPYSVSTAHAHDVQGLLDTVMQGTHRAEANRLRDQYRHPKETLLFFGLRPDMTVVEISPANGWVIPPFLTVCIGRDYAAMASRCFGVNPPKAMLGRS